MRLVVDTSVVISSLLKDSMSRKILLHPDLDLFTPKFVHIEIKNHKNMIMRYTGLEEMDLMFLLNGLLKHIEVIPVDDFKEEMKKAYGIMKDIDEEDTSFLALSLFLDCDGIWSNDSDYTRQDSVKVWKTHDLKKVLKISEF